STSPAPAAPMAAARTPAGTLRRRRAGLPDGRPFRRTGTPSPRTPPFRCRCPPDVQTGSMAAAAEPSGLVPPNDGQRVAGPDDRGSDRASPREDFRVRCTSKRAVAEVLELCGRFVRELGAALPEEIREPAVRDAHLVTELGLLLCPLFAFHVLSSFRDWPVVCLLQTFEAAVQENISIHGQAWQEASDNCCVDSDIKVLEDQFDAVIVDLTTKRKQYPRKILDCVIKTIKAKHEILKQYHPAVHPLDLQCGPDPAPRMETLKCRGETLAKELRDAMKSLPALIEQGEGFAQVLRMQPVIHLQRVHREVFSSCHQKPESQPQSLITQVETTPPETTARKPTDVVLKRRRAADCPQRKGYPLRPKRINLDT
ncbi:Kinetochore-associated protein NSL1, partial [Galemys pyrenaicus]